MQVLGPPLAQQFPSALWSARQRQDPATGSGLSVLAALAVSARAGRKQNLVGVYLRHVHPTANTHHQAGPSPSGADLE